MIRTGLIGTAVAAANEADPLRSEVFDFQQPGQLSAHAPPQAAWLSPRDGAAFEDPRTTIEAEIKSVNGLPITSVTLLHNGTSAKVFKPANLDEAQHFKIRHRFKLFPGRNQVALIAANARATSSAEAARLTLSAPAAQEKSRVHVLSIGISQYQNAGKGFESLTYAADDARAFAEAARSHTNGQLYADVQSKLIVDADATRENILSGLQWLVDQTQPGDVVMLFASAHGFLDDRDNFYLATHGVDKERLRATAISWREILGVLHEELPACKRIVFLDACHGAGLADSGDRNPLHDLAAPELGTIFFASSSLQQSSFEHDEWRHGAFTKAILDVLGDRESDFQPKAGDGLINTLELEAGVSEKVRVMTGDRQHPLTYAPPSAKRINLLEVREVKR